MVQEAKPVCCTMGMVVAAGGGVENAWYSRRKSSAVPWKRNFEGAGRMRQQGGVVESLRIGRLRPRRWRLECSGNMAEKVAVGQNPP